MSRDSRAIPEFGLNYKNMIMRMFTKWPKLQLTSSILTKFVVSHLLPIMILLDSRLVKRESLIDIFVVCIS